MIPRFKRHLKLKQLLLLLTLCFITQVNNSLQAQCTGCTTVIATNSAANFTVGTGVTMCINAGVTYSGNITLNGGTVCNSGTITNITFLRGIFNNYKLFNRNTTITANITGNTTINCYANSTFTVTGAFNVTATSDAFQMNINVERQAQFRLSSNLAHNKGVMNINVGVNGSAVTGQETLLSIGGALTASNAEFNLTNERESTVNITGTSGLNNRFHKRIFNRGTFNANGAFSIGGDAASTGTVFIENRSNFNINNSLTASLANGTVSIVNESNYTFNINTSMTIGRVNHTFTNNGNLTVGTDIIMSGGLLVNNSSVRARDLDVRAARVTNNSQLNVLRNLLANTTTAIVDNNAYINIINKLSNRAVFNLGTGSLLRADSCINTGTAAYLKGPVTAGAALSTFAKLIVNGVSQTDGFMNGNLLVHDRTLVTNTTNVNYGFDNVVNGSTRISSTVVFAARGSTGGSGSPPVINCAALTALYQLDPGPNVIIDCPETLTNLTAQVVNTVGVSPNTSTVLVPYAASSFTWMIGGSATSGNPYAASPSINTTYTVSLNLTTPSCIISNTVSISIKPPPIITIQYLNQPYVFNPSASNNTFPVNLNGLTGGTYTAIPSTLNINSSTGLITANVNTIGNYTVTYSIKSPTTCALVHTYTTVVNFIDVPGTCASINNNIYSYNYTSPGLCYGDQIQLGSTNIGATNFSWTPVIGLSCTNCPNPILHFNNSIPIINNTILAYAVSYQVAGITCPFSSMEVLFRTDCEDNSIIGCCFSNYGAAVYVNDATTHINVYCNVLNEISGLIPSPLSFNKGRFENKGGVNTTQDWIHNGQNTLYVTTYTLSQNPLAVPEGTTSFFGITDQNIRGNSNTHFNNLLLNGNGRRIIQIDEYANGNLDLTSNEFMLQQYNFFMKNPEAIVYRTSGFASSSLNGYFSRVLGANAGNILNKNYLYPLGALGSGVVPTRYRPLELTHNLTAQSTEISANFINLAPSLAIDAEFVNTNSALTNTITDKAANISQLNSNYYHKLKHTSPLSTVSNIGIKSYYPQVEGSYQALAEWEKQAANNYDWWGNTPGASGSNVQSNLAGTFGQIYAMTNGTLNFGGKPFALAVSSLSFNVNLGDPGTIITFSPQPTTTTTTSNSSSTTVTPAGTVTTGNSNTITVNGGVTTGTTLSSTGGVTTTITFTSSTQGGVTSSTISSTSGASTTTSITVTATIGGVVQSTTTIGPSPTATITSISSPTISGSSCSTITASSAGAVTTSVACTTNNGNSSTTVYTITTTLNSVTTVSTQTCVTTGTGNLAATTCSIQGVGSPNISVNTQTTTVSNPTNPTSNTSTNVVGPGSSPYTPNTMAGDYVLSISTPTNSCDIPGKVKFTVTPSGTIDPSSVVFAYANSPNYLGELDNDLYTIDNVNSVISLSAVPSDPLANCVNNMTVTTSVGNDFVLTKSLNEAIVVNIQGMTSVSALFNLYSYASPAPIAISTPINPFNSNSNTITVPGLSGLSDGPYYFEITLTETISNTSKIVKGQLIIK